MMTNEDLETFRDNFAFIGEELEKLKDALGDEGGQGLARERRQAARERRLLADEIRSSQNINAQAAEHLLRIEEGIKEAKASYQALVNITGDELRKRERSVQTGSRMLQEKMSEIEAGLAEAQTQIQELTSLVGQVDSNRKRSQDSLEQVEGRLRQLLDDSAFRKELREIASRDRQTADETFVMEIAQKAIRQALESGVIPKQLQPKPMRPQSGGD